MNCPYSYSRGKASTGCLNDCPKVHAEAYAALSGCDAVRTIACKEDLKALIWHICNALGAGKSVRIALEVVEG